MNASQIQTADITNAQITQLQRSVKCLFFKIKGPYQGFCYQEPSNTDNKCPVSTSSSLAVKTLLNPPNVQSNIQYS